MIVNELEEIFGSDSEYGIDSCKECGAIYAIDFLGESSDCPRCSGESSSENSDEGDWWEEEPDLEELNFDNY